MATPLLSTKLRSPSPRPGLVSRQRLLDRLDQGLAVACKLILISAPAGFGKTTLLAAWAHRLEADTSRPVDVAWISLDPGDDDPARLGAYLAAALRTAERPGAAGGEDVGLAASWLQEPYLVAAINQVAARRRPSILILDDYHAITSPVIHGAVTFVLDHLPDNLHLVLATRADPPLPLPRLRARGHLAELRQSDLRFTPGEAAAFLNETVGLDLNAADVAALEARTEGWIAGLQMAALSLQGTGGVEASRFVQAFTGSHRFVLDYLVEEVLDRQPAALQEFLLRTSILERLTGPLCDAVVGELGRQGGSESQSILEHLDHSNLFILPLDDERRWYRYHRLFADLLRKRLWQTALEMVPTLHRRASAWYEQEGLMPEAIEHALAAHDLDRAAGLVEDHAQATLTRSEVTTFLRWVDRLPDERVRARPGLGFFHAWALLMSGRSLDVVEQRLQGLATSQDPSAGSALLAGRLAALSAYRLLLQADVPRAVDLSRQALECLPETERYLRGVAAWMLSLAKAAEADLPRASEALAESARLGLELGSPLIAVASLCHQARFEERQGRLPQAKEILDRALEWATDAGGRRLPIASKALIGLGELWREWNDLDAAAGCLVESIELAGQWSEMAAFDAYYPLARVRLAQGDVQAAREVMADGRQLAARSASTQVDDLLAELQHAHLAVSLGDLDEAGRWAGRRGLLARLSPGFRPDPGEDPDSVAAHLRKYELLVLARLFILQGRAAEALEVLQPLLSQAQDLGRVDLAVEIQIQQALAHQAQGQDDQALRALAGALALAAPGGYVRTFLDKGEPLARLLRRTAARDLAPAYTARLLAAFGGAEAAGVPSLAAPLVEPLSERELEVLRLLAAGLSNPEIAAELVVAASTVHSHCKSIYGKLGVHRRWDAVQRARGLGLL